MIKLNSHSFFELKKLIMLEIYIDPDYFSFEHFVAFVFTKLITIYEHKKIFFSL